MQDDSAGRPGANLQRFIDAQAPVYDTVIEELRQGRKRNHWIWYIFPQIQGLGRSEMAAHYAIGSLDEARAYLDHPLLGMRLRECTRLVCAIEGRSITQIMGPPDDMKFRSSMTLFDAAAPADTLFAGALDRYFGGGRDALTLARI
jgi:uncharacterized protein (DUF1810 family)